MAFGAVFKRVGSESKQRAVIHAGEPVPVTAGGVRRGDCGLCETAVRLANTSRRKHRGSAEKLLKSLGYKFEKL
jgi:hypothetical protein